MINLKIAVSLLMVLFSFQLCLGENDSIFIKTKHRIKQSFTKTFINEFQVGYENIYSQKCSFETDIGVLFRNPLLESSRFNFLMKQYQFQELLNSEHGFSFTLSNKWYLKKHNLNTLHFLKLSEVYCFFSSDKQTYEDSGGSLTIGKSYITSSGKGYSFETDIIYGFEHFYHKILLEFYYGLGLKYIYYSNTQYPMTIGNRNSPITENKFMFFPSAKVGLNIGFPFYRK